MITNNSIADNLKKYHKYIELQKIDTKNKSIYNYKIARYRKLLQDGGVKLDQLDRTPLETINGTIRQIDGILGKKPMAGGVGLLENEIKNLERIRSNFTQELDEKRAVLLAQQQQIAVKINALVRARDKLQVDLDEARTQCSISGEMSAKQIQTIQELTGRITFLESTLKEEQQKLADVHKQLKGVQEQLTAANQQIEVQNQKIEAQKVQFEAKEAELETEKINLSKIKEEFTTETASLNGQIEKLQKAILNGLSELGNFESQMFTEISNAFLISQQEDTQQPPQGSSQQPPQGSSQQPPQGSSQQPPQGSSQQPPQGSSQQPPQGSSSQQRPP